MKKDNNGKNGPGQSIPPKSVRKPSTLEERIQSCIIGADEFVKKEISSPERMIDPWLLDSSLSIIYGLPGVGKTMLALLIAGLVTRNVEQLKAGKKIGNWELTNNGSALIIDGEMHEFDFQQRIEKITNTLGPEDENYPFVLLSASSSLAYPGSPARLLS